MQQPVKYGNNPILRPDRPYEHRRAHLYGTILRDPEVKLFKMWYSTHDKKEGTSRLCYAVSEDGYSWQKPDLDVVPGTNIVLPEEQRTHGPSVILDLDEADPSKRYKLLMRPSKIPYILAYFSADGVHWHKAQDEPVIKADSDCHIGLYRDPETGLYQASLRFYHVDRRVWRTESEDFMEWRRPVLALEPEANEPPQTQIYGMQMSPYGSFIMGWISMYNTEETDMRWSKMDGTMDVQLAYSRGGYCWHRTDPGRRFIPLGEEGSWDSMLLIPSTGPVLLEEEIRFYFSGAPYPHGFDSENEFECIGAASLRPDGFVALRAGEETCEFLTRSFAMTEPGIFINADAPGGMLKIEVCESSGKPIEGFSFPECRAVRGDSAALQVRWAEGADISRMTVRPIRIRVRARRADLYSIWMPNGDKTTRYWDFHEITCLDPLK